VHEVHQGISRVSHPHTLQPTAHAFEVRGRPTPKRLATLGKADEVDTERCPRVRGEASAGQPDIEPSFRRKVTAAMPGPVTSSRTSRGSVSHGDCPRPELAAVHELYYYTPDGNGGKRFGVRFREKTTAHVWDNASNTQANYHGDSVTTSDASIVVQYRDADLGLTEVGTIAAFSHVNGVDTQVEIPVTLLR
jgi:hypothetical protein